MEAAPGGQQRRMEPVGAYPGYPLPEAPAPEFSLGLDEILRALLRGIWILIGAVAVGVGLMALLLTQLTPVYTAESTVLIGAPDVAIAPVNEVIEDNPGDDEAARNEVFVLSSRSFADRVIRQLDLDRDPEFNPALKQDESEDGGESADGSDGRPGKVREAQRRTAIIDRFLNQLRVAVKPDSRVISVRFTSEDPERAAEVANAIAETYLLSRREARFESTRTANAWLLDRIETLRADVEAGEQAIEQMREKYSLLSTGGVTLASQRLAELSAQLLRAGTARAEAQARLSQVRRAQQSGDGINTNSQVLNSPLIQRLREQQAQVERRIGELSVEFGEKHPRMIQARAEASDVEEAIDAEISRIVSRLENDVAVARAQEEMLAKSVEDQKELVAESNRNEIELRALEREVTSNRLLLDTLLARQKETLSQEDFDYQRADARIISKAFVPTEPSFPNRKIMFGLAVFGSGLVGLVLILLREMLDSGFRSGEELEKDTGVHSLGFLPFMNDLADSGNVHNYVVEKPNSAYSEAVRTLNWSVNLLYPNDPPRVILMTSSEPGEGKTTVATAFATLRERSGQRAVIVDADTRRPTIHRMFDLPREPGLVDILNGEARVQDVIQPTEGGKPDVVCAGRFDVNAANFLDSYAMTTLVEDLCSMYDLVVIDSPPVLAGVDARILSGITDSTVFVVRWGATRRPVVRLALRQLEEAGGKIAGTLLSGVQVRKYAKYAYGDSGAYVGELGKYYVE